MRQRMIAIVCLLPLSFPVFAQIQAEGRELVAHDAALGRADGARLRAGVGGRLQVRVADDER